MDPQPRGPDWMPITPKTASLFHADSHSIAADELLRQVLVMGWGAFEVLASDLIVTLASHKPSTALLILKSNSKYVNCSIGVETFERYGFDLSSSMGRVLRDAIKTDSLSAIREIYTVALNSSGLDKVLCNKQLWLVFQRRNLIAHRRGVVDQRYLSITSDSLPVGEMMKISSEDAEATLEIVRDAGIGIIRDVIKASEE